MRFLADDVFGNSLLEKNISLVTKAEKAPVEEKKFLNVYMQKTARGRLLGFLDWPILSTISTRLGIERHFQLPPQSTTQ